MPPLTHQRLRNRVKNFLYDYVDDELRRAFVRGAFPASARSLQGMDFSGNNHVFVQRLLDEAWKYNRYYGWITLLRAVRQDVGESIQEDIDDLINQIGEVERASRIMGVSVPAPNTIKRVLIAFTALLILGIGVGIYAWVTRPPLSAYSFVIDISENMNGDINGESYLDVARRIIYTNMNSGVSPHRHITVRTIGGGDVDNCTQTDRLIASRRQGIQPNMLNRILNPLTVRGNSGYGAGFNAVLDDFAALGAKEQVVFFFIGDDEPSDNCANTDTFDLITLNSNLEAAGIEAVTCAFTFFDEVYDYNEFRQQLGDSAGECIHNIQNEDDIERTLAMVDREVRRVEARVRNEPTPPPLPTLTSSPTPSDTPTATPSLVPSDTPTPTITLPADAMQRRDTDTPSPTPTQPN